MLFKTIKSLAFAGILSVSYLTSVSASELKFFTIGTGGTAYTYYPVGGMIANAISKPRDHVNVEKVEAVALTD